MKSSSLVFIALAPLLLANHVTGSADAKHVTGNGDLKLVVLHLNDFHAHVEQVNEKLTRCRPGKALSLGETGPTHPLNGKGILNGKKQTS